MFFKTVAEFLATLGLTAAVLFRLDFCSGLQQRLGALQDMDRRDRDGADQNITMAPTIAPNTASSARMTEPSSR